jgi:peptidoglycan hydrolase-like protein with peptidoglycan-binding domain
MSMAKKKKAAPRRKTAPVYEESSFRIPMPAVIRERPLDSFAMFLAGSAAIAIIFNAVMLQNVKGVRREPAPVAAAIPAPRPNIVATPAASAAPAAPAAVSASARPDDPNMLVREVQAELVRRGLYDGPADGLFGPKTEAAILDYEIGAGLKPTGHPNPQLLTAMRTPTAVSQPAAASPRIAAVQRVLDQQRFGPVKADGVAGEATRAAIRRFEASRGLPQKGEINPTILRELSQASGVNLN